MAETDIKRGLQDLWALLTDEERAALVDNAIVQTFRKGESL